MAQEYSENGLESAKRQLAERPQNELYDGDPTVPDLDWYTGRRLEFVEGASDFSTVSIVLDTARSTDTTNMYKVTSKGTNVDRQRNLNASMSTPNPPPVLASNEKPDAVDDPVSMDSGGVTYVQVTANDSDPEGDVLR